MKRVSLNNFTEFNLTREEKEDFYRHRYVMLTAPHRRLTESWRVVPVVRKLYGLKSRWLLSKKKLDAVELSNDRSRRPIV